VKGEEEKKTKSCGNGSYCDKMKEEKKRFSKWGASQGREKLNEKKSFQNGLNGLIHQFVH
jgi:hypothetical protein